MGRKAKAPPSPISRLRVSQPLWLIPKHTPSKTSLTKSLRQALLHGSWIDPWYITGFTDFLIKVKQEHPLQHEDPTLSPLTLKISKQPGATSRFLWFTEPSEIQEERTKLIEGIFLAASGPQADF